MACDPSNLFELESYFWSKPLMADEILLRDGTDTIFSGEG